MTRSVLLRSSLALLLGTIAAPLAAISPAGQDDSGNSGATSAQDSGAEVRGETDAEVLELLLTSLSPDKPGEYLEMARQLIQSRDLERIDTAVHCLRVAFTYGDQNTQLKALEQLALLGDDQIASAAAALLLRHAQSTERIQFVLTLASRRQDHGGQAVAARQLAASILEDALERNDIGVFAELQGDPRTQKVFARLHALCTVISNGRVSLRRRLKHYTAVTPVEEERASQSQRQFGKGRSCRKCGGKGVVDCRRCVGGTLRCPRCKGSGTIRTYRDFVRRVTLPNGTEVTYPVRRLVELRCPACVTAGLPPRRPCPNCGGRGVLRCPDCAKQTGPMPRPVMTANHTRRLSPEEVSVFRHLLNELRSDRAGLYEAYLESGFVRFSACSEKVARKRLETNKPYWRNGEWCELP